MKISNQPFMRQHYGMSHSKGFSLFEVLISLLLISSISLAMLKQQWKSNLFLSDATHHLEHLLNMDNQHESRDKIDA